LADAKETDILQKEVFRLDLQYRTDTRHLPKDSADQKKLRTELYQELYKNIIQDLTKQHILFDERLQDSAAAQNQERAKARVAFAAEHGAQAVSQSSAGRGVGDRQIDPRTPHFQPGREAQHKAGSDTELEVESVDGGISSSGSDSAGPVSSVAVSNTRVAARPERERVLFIGTQFSILYTFMYSPA
jgi:hypothetical protein